MLQFQHVYIHMNMHVKMHMKMHMYKPVTHTISSAKPHGVILIGWCGSGSHLDVDGASV